MSKNKDVTFRVFLFVLGMMLVVYGWRSLFKGLLDVEHQWARLVFGPLAVSTGLIIFYLLFLKKTKKDK
jgi:cytochrome c biogenesis protein CcdA